MALSIAQSERRRQRKVIIHEESDPLVLYRGRVTRIPLRAPNKLRDDGIQLWPIEPWWGQKVPNTVQDRVGSFWNIPFPDDLTEGGIYELTSVVGTQDGVLIHSRVIPELIYVTVPETVFFVPTKLKYVSKVEIRAIHPFQREGAKRSKYDAPYVIMSLSEGNDTKTWASPEGIRRQLELLKPHGTGMISDVPGDNTETWILKANRECPERSPSNLYLYGRSAVKVANGDFTGFGDAEIKDGNLILTPKNLQDVFQLGNPAWKNPLKVNIEDLTSEDVSLE